MASGEQRPTARLRGIAALVLAQAALSPPAGAQRQERVDLELLAYLGSWQESDEDWLAVAEWNAKGETEGAEPEPPREEKDDE